MTEGERWASEALHSLSADQFGPRAWARFLRSSFQRAADTRRTRPQLARQAHAWSTLGLCTGVAVCVAAARESIPAPRPSRFALWWLAVSAMLDWHLGMIEGPDGELRERLSAADALTLLRLGSVPLLAAQDDPGQRSARAFTALIACAAASDALDGILARRAGTTRLGRDLDTIADALTIVTAAGAARRAGWIPAGASKLAAARSAAPVAVVAAGYFGDGQRPATDSVTHTRALAPVLLGGLAAAPFSHRAGAALTSAACLAALALMPPHTRKSGRELVTRITSR